MKNARDAGFSRRRGGNAGSGPPLPDPVPSSSARNVGIIFHKCFNFEDHIKSICKSSHYYIRSIAKIRKYIGEESAKIIVYAFVTAKLDSCDSLLYGLPQHLISRLQSIQNTVARVVTRSRKFDHMTTFPLPYSF